MRVPPSLLNKEIDEVHENPRSLLAILKTIHVEHQLVFSRSDRMV
jgi:hypothetical protein